MNFQDLLKTIKNIDEGKSIEECGMMPPMGHMSPPKQSDSVTMNVSMNGSGAGGIKDLMNILKNIEDGAGHGSQHDDDELIIGEPGDLDVKMAELEDSYDNEPHTSVAGIDAITRTGDDLASKGKEAPKVNGGGNPMQEADTAGQEIWRPAYRAALDAAMRDPRVKGQLDQLRKEYDVDNTAIIKAGSTPKSIAFRQQVDLKYKQDLENLVKTNAGYGAQPTQMQEGLVQRLAQHYEEVKSR